VSRRGIVEIVEGYYLALALDGLHQAGVLAALAASPMDAESLGRRLGLAAGLLERLLDFVAARTDLVVKESGGFAINADPRTLRLTRHMLDQYVGAYGPLLGRLPTLLKDPAAGPALVDRARHAAAFAGPDDGASASCAETVRLILELGATSIVDLGCGGGHLLCDAAAANPDLRGLGIDSNPEAVKVARRLARRRGVDGRIEATCGDALDVIGRRGDQERRGVQLVVASSMLNARWTAPGDAVQFLQRLARLLPGRILIVSDYYSRLQAGGANEAGSRTLIHDIAQLLSGQGLPPASLEGWEGAYRAAGADLLHGFEATGDGIERFIHIVKLAEPPPEPSPTKRKARWRQPGRAEAAPPSTPESPKSAP